MLCTHDKIPNAYALRASILHSTKHVVVPPFHRGRIVFHVHGVRAKHVACPLESGAAPGLSLAFGNHVSQQLLTKRQDVFHVGENFRYIVCDTQTEIDERSDQSRGIAATAAGELAILC